jgi:hypothetical protein
MLKQISPFEATTLDANTGLDDTVEMTSAVRAQQAPREPMPFVPVC